MNASDTHDRMPAITTPATSSASWLGFVKVILLASPAFLPIYFHYALAEPGQVATGALIKDSPYYLANAREYFDTDSFSLFYGNPNDFNRNTPRIYFQPQTLLLGAVWRATGVPLMSLYYGFGFAWSLALVAVALRLLAAVVRPIPGVPWLLLQILFIWGGGVLAVTGLLAYWPGDIFAFDPFNGWWFLNLGRNMVMPFEAYYHAVFLGCILLLIQERYSAALLAAGLLSMSHPFTGVQLLLVVVSYLGFERFYLRRPTVPLQAVWIAVGLLAVHLGYYLFLLPRFPVHSSIHEAWKESWTYEIEHMVLAYGPVAVFALWNARRPELAVRWLSSPAVRLLLCWALVSFVLANHEFLIKKPIQPLHFTRGYVWTPLFLLASPTILDILEKLWAARSRPVCIATLAAGMVMGISDNLLWIASHAAPQSKVRSGVYLTEDQHHVLRWLAAHSTTDTVLVASEPTVMYFATADTPCRSWFAHYNCTPEAKARVQELEDFFLKGKGQDAWDGMPLMIAAHPGFLPRIDAWMAERSQRIEEVCSTPSLVLYAVRPAQ